MRIRASNDYNDMPVEHVVSLEYLISIIVLYCVLAAFCQLLLNEYCIVLYCSMCNASTITNCSILRWIDALAVLNPAFKYTAIFVFRYVFSCNHHHNYISSDCGNIIINLHNIRAEALICLKHCDIPALPSLLQASFN